MTMRCNYCGHATEHDRFGYLVRCVCCPGGRCEGRENPEYPSLWRCLGSEDEPHDEIQFRARAVDDPHCWYCSRAMLPPEMVPAAA
jgi:hypothetical protein